MPPWVPNAISAFRVLLIPVWVLVAERHRALLLDGEGHPRLALLSLLLALGLSDLLDGWIARRFGLETHLGAVLDATADKMAQITMITYLTFRPAPDLFPLPLGLWVLLLVRDGVMATGWWTVKRRCGHVVSEHRWHGKAASLLLFVTLFALLAGLAGPAMWALVVSTSALVAGSTLDYVRLGALQIRGAGRGT